MFTFWAAVDPQTAFQDVHSLRLGIMLVCEQGRQSSQSYWELDIRARIARSREMSFGEATGEVRKRLLDAVRLQLRADVPVGAYLSGGLDSSGIVSLIRNHTRNRVRTFSVAFEEPEFDESEQQAAMVRHLNTEHVDRALQPAADRRALPTADLAYGDARGAHGTRAIDDAVGPGSQLWVQGRADRRGRRRGVRGL